MLRAFCLLWRLRICCSNLFFPQINGGVEIALAIFGEQIRPADAEAHRATELPLRNPHMIVLERDPRMDDAGVQAIQFIELREQRASQWHPSTLRCAWRGSTSCRQHAAASININRQFLEDKPRMNTDEHG